MLYIIYFIVCIQFLYPGMVRYLNLPPLPSLFSEVIIFSVFILSILFKRNKWLNRGIDKILFLLALLFVVIIISSILNQTGFLLTFKSVIEFNFLYIFLFLSLLNINSSEIEQKILLNLILALILIQIPAVSYQYLYENNLSADSNSGTLSMNLLGGTGINAVLSAMAFSVFLCAVIFKGLKPVYLTALVLLLIPSFAGGARFGFLLILISIAAGIILIPYISGKYGAKRLVYASLAGAVILTGLWFVYDKAVPASKYPNYIGSMEMIVNPNKMIDYDQSGHASKIDAYNDLLNKSINNKYNLIFGWGGGAITKSASFSLSGSVNDYSRNYPDSIKILLSNGSAGMILLLILFLSFIPVMKKYLAVENKDFFRINGAAFIIFTILIILSLTYTSTYASPIGLVYWSYAGILTRRYIVLSQFNLQLKSL